MNRFRRGLISACTFTLTTCGLLVAQAPSTRPTVSSSEVGTSPATMTKGGLDDQASKALESKDYPTALALLRRMADVYRNDARKSSAIALQIKDCESLIAMGASGTSAEQRKPHPAVAAGEIVSFDSIKDLGNFEYDSDKGGGIPNDVKALTGHAIKLKGFMIPMDQAETITQFALVPSLFSCCFGAPPGIQHTIIVHTPKGKSVSYFPDEIVIQGKLRVDERKEDGFIVSIFEVTADSVKPASP